MSIELLPIEKTKRGSYTSSKLLQSWEWGMVQREDGHHVFLGIIKNKKTEAIFLVIKYNLPFNKNWFYTPSFPEDIDEHNFYSIIKSLILEAKKHDALFWKIDTVPESSDHTIPAPHRKTPPLQYPETYILDLAKNETALLQAMKQKTRYNISLAEKRGVTVRWSDGKRDSAILYNLLKDTASRQHIHLHPMVHYKNIIKLLAAHDHSKLLIAFHKQTPIAANLITFYGNTATYLHGGSDSTYRAFMAPYLLQWEAIKKAKQREFNYYDLGGCAVKTGKVHDWAGITRFKQGFGGNLVHLGESYEIIVNPLWYYLYKTSQLIKQKLKR